MQVTALRDIYLGATAMPTCYMQTPMRPEQPALLPKETAFGHRNTKPPLAPMITRRMPQPTHENIFRIIGVR